MYCLLHIPESERTVAIEELDADTILDLKLQLECNRKKIKEKYASFAVSLCEAIETTGVSLKKFRLYILGLSAFESQHDSEQPILLDDVKAKIEKADSIHKIFEVLTTDCCSFINVDIFQSIIDKYKINTDSDEDLQYSEHLKTYLENHTIAEFATINPNLKNFPKDSEILTLKFDITLPSRITKVFNLKGAIAKILGVKAHTLHLVGIEKGCVILRFLLPATVAAYIFASGLTAQQEAGIRALSVLWLKCGDYTLEEAPSHSISSLHGSEGSMVDYKVLQSMREDDEGKEGIMPQKVEVGVGEGGKLFAQHQALLQQKIQKGKYRKAIMCKNFRGHSK